jgi:nucleoside-diphosphate-sugar epimerase
MPTAKILVVGASGSVGFPLAVGLARDSSNEVWGLARFTDQATKQRLEESGVRCIVGDLGRGDLGEVPQDFTYVLNFSTVKSMDNDWDSDLDTNVGGLGFVMEHCRSARAVLHCSSTNVYKANGHHPFRETDPLGDTPRPSAAMATYTICKIASEAMARYGARQYQVPTTIARLNVPYGEHGGWPAAHAEMIVARKPIPVHTNAPSLFNPIHHDDLVAMVPRLLDIADVPAVVVNWGGDEAVSIEDWCAYIGTLLGRTPALVSTDEVVQSTAIDLTKMHELVGHTTVPWREGMRRMVTHRYSELDTA